MNQMLVAEKIKELMRKWQIDRDEADNAGRIAHAAGNTFLEAECQGFYKAKIECREELKNLADVVSRIVNA